MRMSGHKPKLAIVPGMDCSGCDYSLLDLGEAVVDALSSVELVFWPTATDSKVSDLRDQPDKGVDIVLYEGAVGNEENLELARLARKKAKTLFAFGSCACIGGVPGLGNVTNSRELIDTAYVMAPSNVNGDRLRPKARTKIDGKELTLPVTFDTVVPLDQVVHLDYYLPGCPPPLKFSLEALTATLKGRLPPRGYVFASPKSLCDECPRKREGKNEIAMIRRFHEIEPNADRCLLEQGLVCLGPATRGGCGGACVETNIPCRGCMGPTPGSIDQGARMLSAIASVLGVKNEAELTDEEVEEVEEQIEEIKDPLGTFYRFGLPASLLRRVMMKEQV